MSDFKLVKLIDPIIISTSGVTSIQGGVSGTPAAGAIRLLPGANTTISQSGQDVTIASTGGGGGGVTSVAFNGGAPQTGAVAITQQNSDWTAVTGPTVIVNKPTIPAGTTVQGGVSGTPLAGAVRLLPGTNTTISQSGQDITIAATGGGGVISGTTVPTDSTGVDGQTYQLLNSSGLVLAVYTRANPSPVTNKWVKEQNVRVDPTVATSVGIASTITTVGNNTPGTRNFQEVSARLSYVINGLKRTIDAFVIQVSSTDGYDDILNTILLALNSRTAVVFTKTTLANDSFTLTVFAPSNISAFDYNGIVMTQVGDVIGGPIQTWTPIQYALGSWVISPGNNQQYYSIQTVPNTVGLPENNPTYWTQGVAKSVQTVGGGVSQIFNSPQIGDGLQAFKILSRSLLPTITSFNGDLVVSQYSYAADSVNFDLSLAAQYIKAAYDPYSNVSGPLRIGSTLNKPVILGTEGNDAFIVGQSATESITRVSGGNPLQFNVYDVVGGGVDRLGNLYIVLTNGTVYKATAANPTNWTSFWSSGITNVSACNITDTNPSYITLGTGESGGSVNAKIASLDSNGNLQNVYSGTWATGFQGGLVDFAFNGTGTLAMLGVVYNVVSGVWTLISAPVTLAGTGLTGTITFGLQTTLSLSISQVPDSFAFINSATAYGVTNSGALYSYTRSGVSGLTVSLVQSGFISDQGQGDIPSTQANGNFFVSTAFDGSVSVRNFVANSTIRFGPPAVSGRVLANAYMAGVSPTGVPISVNRTGVATVTGTDVAYVVKYALSDSVVSLLPHRFTGGVYDNSNTLIPANNLVLASGSTDISGLPPNASDTAQYLSSVNGGKPQWSAPPSSAPINRMAVFNISETTTANGAATFGVGGATGGAVTALVNNISGLSGPTGASSTARAWTIPAGTYRITLPLAFTSVPGGSVSVLSNFGPNPDISGSSDITKMSFTLTKIQAGGDDLGGTSVGYFVFATSTNFYLSRFSANINTGAAGAVSLRLSSGSLVMFELLS